VELSLLNVDHGGLFYDFFQLVQFAFATAWAVSTEVIPRLGGIQVRFPEWPRSTLSGTVLVNRTQATV
jgi:hypothetical protein